MSLTAEAEKDGSSFHSNRNPPVRKLFTDPSEYTEDQENAQVFETFRVFLRIKPNSILNNLADCIKIVDNNKLICKPPITSKCRKTEKMEYVFSHIFGPKTTQHEIFVECVSQCVEDLLDGRDSLIFTYGTTNAGKTYTVQGSPKNPGIIPEALHTLFHNIKVEQKIEYKPYYAKDILKLTPESVREDEMLRKKVLNIYNDNSKTSKPATYQFESKLFMHMLDNNVTYLKNRNSCCSVWISFLEVYNDTIYDLLYFDPADRKPLKVATDLRRNFYVKGLKQICVHSAEEAFTIYQFGKKNLKVASTKLNDRSSRSHCIFTIHVVNLDDKDQIIVAKLRICDLAGIERQTKAENSGLRLKESKSINVSLFQLNCCITAIRENQQKNTKQLIPYRGFNLTKLFQSALDSAQEKIIMIVNINPAPNLYDETKQVLQTCALASKIRNKPICGKNTTQSNRFSTFIYGQKSEVSNEDELFDDFDEDEDEDIFEEEFAEQHEVEELKKKLAHQDVEIVRLKQHVEIYRNSKEELKKHLERRGDIYEDRIKSLTERNKSQKEYYERKIDAIRRETVDANYDEKSIKEELHKKDIHIEDLEAKLHELELKDHRSSVTTVIPPDIIIEKDLKMKELESLLEEARTEYIGLTKKYSSNFTKLSDVECELNKQTEMNEAMSHALQTKDKLVEELEQKIELLEETLSSNTIEHESVLTRLEKERDEAKKICSETKQNADALNFVIEEMKQEMAEQVSRIEQVEKEKEELRSALERKFKALENEQVKMEEKLEASKRKEAQTKNIMTTLEKERTSLGNKIIALENELSNLEGKLKALENRQVNCEDQGRRYNMRKHNINTLGKENSILFKHTPLFLDSNKKSRKLRNKDKIPLAEHYLNDSLEMNVFQKIPKSDLVPSIFEDEEIIVTGKKTLFPSSPICVDLVSPYNDRDCSILPNLHVNPSNVATPAQTSKLMKKKGVN